MTRAAALALVLAGCGGKAAPPAGPAPTEEVTGTYRFDWSPPCRVPVLERSHRKGHDVTLRYTVEVTRVDEGALRVDLIDIAAEAPEVERVFAAFPAVIVGDDGGYIATESLDEVIELSIAAMPDPAAARAAFDSLRDEMAVKFAEPWLTWVGHWVEWSLAPGERHELELAAPAPDGSEVPFVATIEHAGMVDGQARLRYVERLEGESLKRLMEPMLRSMVGVAPDPAEAERFFVEMTVEGHRESSYEVWTSPVDLRPRRARQDTRAEIQINGEAGDRSHEWREWAFDWARAVGCGR